MGGASDIAENATKALLSLLGGMLVQLGELAITTGVGLLAVQTAFETLNPYVAIAAGVAMVALGALFNQGAKNIGASGFGGSGGSSLATSGGGGSNTGGGRRFDTGVGGSGGGGLSSSTGSAINGDAFGEVRFEIEGTSLVGVLQNYLQEQSGLGGPSQIIIN